MPNTPQPENKPTSDVPVVGIGASAGGLEAFSALLGALPPDTGMAFVLIAHLMPEKKSALGEILARKTQMPVTQVPDSAAVEPNHVYVIPPNSALTIEGGNLHAQTLTSTERPTMLIDRFFRSLAQDRKSKAIGVVLSGTGADGTLGLEAIKGETGITFVQDPASAAFSDMPKNAEAAADYVLAPEQIAEELKRIATHPYVSRPLVPVESLPDTDSALKQIFRIVHAISAVDFSLYKPPSIRRRIARRMVLKKIESLGEYLTRLKTDTAEAKALSEDLLITVTEFFRDPETFDFLKKEIIPQILDKVSDDTAARVWVPGCASGEEAYSIAICFVETAKGRTIPPVQIFATDVSKPSIGRARRAVYPESIAANVSPERLRRFFVKTEGGYQVAKFIRDLCIFAEQNVIADAPFSRIDLISCRNLLIYLDTPTQREVLHRFHYSLKPTGFLLLGASESVAAAADIFEQVHKTERIFTKLQTTARVAFSLTPSTVREVGSRAPVIRPALLEVGRDADHFLLGRFAPPGVVLNPEFEIVEFRGSISGVLQPTPGEATLNVFKMVRQELSEPLRTALNDARTSATPIRREGVELLGDHETLKLNLEVVRLRPDATQRAHYLVLFENAIPQEEPKTRYIKQAGHSAGRRIQELREELTSADAKLRTVTAEQRNTNQELQSANEEILASNEELQSMNEEMQTAREELQAANEELHSVNEELQSVNEELQRRNEELGQAYNDLSTLVLSTEVAYVLVDEDLRIRRFTPPAEHLFNLLPSDVGRPIADIEPDIDVPDLKQQIEYVVKSISFFEREVQDSQGHWYCIRIRPFKSETMKIAGAVVTLLDIQKLKVAEAAVQESDANWQKLIDELPNFIVDARGQILYINRALAGLTEEARISASLYDVIAESDRTKLEQCLADLLKTGIASTCEATGSSALDNAPMHVEFSPIKSGGRIVTIAVRIKELQRLANLRKGREAS